MNQALFESLTGTFLDGTPVDDISRHNRYLRSIMDHLNRIFNTRNGSLSHLNDYGLPDISEIYRKMPYGIELLQDAIRRTVEKYEPRLKNVVIKPEEDNNDKFRLIFLLSAELSNGGGTVRFQTTFTSQGASSISPWKRNE